MPYDTFWDSICRLAGESGDQTIPLAEAIDGSAVPDKIARIELRRFLEDGLVEGDDQAIRLTERGRRACETLGDANRSSRFGQAFPAQGPPEP